MYFPVHETPSTEKKRSFPFLTSHAGIPPTKKTKKNSTNHKKVQSPSLTDLPQELILECFKYLPFSQLQFQKHKCVSKTWTLVCELTTKNYLLNKINEISFLPKNYSKQDSESIQRELYNLKKTTLETLTFGTQTSYLKKWLEIISKKQEKIDEDLFFSNIYAALDCPSQEPVEKNKSTVISLSLEKKHDEMAFALADYWIDPLTIDFSLSRNIQKYLIKKVGMKGALDATLTFNDRNHQYHHLIAFLIECYEKYGKNLPKYEENLHEFEQKIYPFTLSFFKKIAIEEPEKLVNEILIPLTSTSPSKWSAKIINDLLLFIPQEYGFSQLDFPLILFYIIEISTTSILSKYNKEWSEERRNTLIRVFEKIPHHQFRKIVITNLYVWYNENLQDVDYWWETFYDVGKKFHALQFITVDAEYADYPTEILILYLLDQDPQKLISHLKSAIPIKKKFQEAIGDLLKIKPEWFENILSTRIKSSLISEKLAQEILLLIQILKTKTDETYDNVHMEISNETTQLSLL